MATVESRPPADPVNGTADEDVEMQDQQPQSILEIPIEDGGQMVSIDLDNDLPEDPSEICTLLENEHSAPEYWLAIATAYARNGSVENAIEVVKTGLAAAAGGSEADSLPFYSCLAWLYLKQLRRAPATTLDAAGSSGGAPLTKADYHRMATEVGNKAYQLDRSWSVNILARGALTLAVGRFDDALAPFQTVLEQSGDANLFAKLGKARVLYHKKNYRAALRLYQDVLLGRPNLRPDPRLGVGLCFWRLGDKEAARAAWERSLEVQGAQNVEANSLLGLWHMDSAMQQFGTDAFADEYAAALRYTQAAYKADPAGAAEPAILLARHLFSRKRMDEVLKLCEKVSASSDVPAIQAEALFWMGRVYHFREDYDEALKCYERAVAESPSPFLPLLAKGLVQLAQDSPEAVLTFESVVSANPKSPESLLLFGLLSGKRALTDSKRVHAAVTVLERYLYLCKEQKRRPETDALLMLARLTEQSKPDTAMNALREVELSLELSGTETENGILRAQVQNNLGVLHYFNGNFDAARKHLEQARDALGSVETGSPDMDAAEKLKVSVMFNLARLDDATGNADGARQGYKAVLDAAPGYLDAQIRLCYIDAALGAPGAEKHIEALLADNPKNLEVRSLYGWFLRRQRRQGARGADDGSEQKHYKQTLVEHNKHDCYSLVALGNIYLAIAREIRVAKNADAERKDKSYLKAAELFDKALHLDPRNAFAAQGIAIIFAETKRPELAMHFFGKIRETLDDISVHVNSGHCLLELRQFAKAIESYEYALDNFRGGHDLQLMTLLGRAWYARGVSEKSVPALRTALEYAEKAFAQQPSNLALKFNVAFMQFQLAENVRRAATNQRTQGDIELAAEGLEKAIEAMKDISKQKQPPYPPAELEQRALMGENTLRKQLERALAEQKEYDESAEAKLEQARRLREEERAKAEEEKRKHEEEVRAREEKLAEERKRLQEEALKWSEDLTTRIAQEKEKADKKPKTKGSKKSSSRKKKNDDDVSDVSDVEERARKPRGRKSALSDEFINDSDISSYASGSDNESDAGSNAPSDAGSDNEAKSSPRKRKSSTPAQDDAAKSKKKRRGAKIVDDDDDDEDNDLFGDD